MYEKFEKLCAEKGVTPYKVSKETGVSTATLTSWKQGKYNPKKEKLQKIADFFEVPISYFYDESSKIPVIKFLSGVGGLSKGLQEKNGKFNVHIEIIDEPDIHLHSKTAYNLVNKIKDMPDDDLDFLLKTAEKISPTPKETKKDIIPFPNFPTVTNKDIDEFAARNAKKKFSREEIAEIIYEMRKDD